MKGCCYICSSTVHQKRPCPKSKPEKEAVTPPNTTMLVEDADMTHTRKDYVEAQKKKDLHKSTKILASSVMYKVGVFNEFKSRYRLHNRFG